MNRRVFDTEWAILFRLYAKTQRNSAILVSAPRRSASEDHFAHCKRPIQLATV